MSVAYRAMGLWRNPFGELSAQSRSELFVERETLPDPAEVREWLDLPGRVVQIRGRSGRGKSSFLHALRAIDPEIPYVYVARGTRPEIPRARLVIIDELWRLSWRIPQLWRRAGASYLVASHWDHRLSARIGGLDCRSYRVHGLSEVELGAYVDARILAQCRPEVDPSGLRRPSIERLRHLLVTYGDDLRAIEGVLFDDYERWRRETRGETWDAQG